MKYIYRFCNGGMCGLLVMLNLGLATLVFNFTEKGIASTILTIQISIACVYFTGWAIEKMVESNK